jgi:hypothetical protein
MNNKKRLFKIPFIAVTRVKRYIYLEIRLISVKITIIENMILINNNICKSNAGLHIISD